MKNSTGNGARWMLAVSLTTAAFAPLATADEIAGKAPALSGQADIQWQRVGDGMTLVEPFDGVSTYRDAIYRWGGNSPEFWRWWNRARTYRRDAGIVAWDRYPDDRKRFKWLTETIQFPPLYWKNEQQGMEAYGNGKPEYAEVDHDAEARWNNDYVRFRAEIMASKTITDADRANFRLGELAARVENMQYALRRGERADISQLAIQFLDAVSHPSIKADDEWQWHTEYAQLIAGFILDVMDSTPALQRAFLAGMEALNGPRWGRFIVGKKQTLQLREQPLQLSLISFSGESVDLRSLRGKVVLVDIWSNHCASCIAAMPKLRRVYDRYRDKGFEIVGIWLSTNPALEQPVAVNISRRQGASWPNAVMGGRDREAFMEQYSVSGVPVTWLLDQEGKLVTTDVSNEKLEAKITRLLGIDRRAADRTAAVGANDGSTVPLARNAPQPMTKADRLAAFPAWKAIQALWYEQPVDKAALIKASIDYVCMYPGDERPPQIMNVLVNMLRGNLELLQQVGKRIAHELSVSTVSEGSWAELKAAQIFLEANMEGSEAELDPASLRRKIEELRNRFPAAEILRPERADFLYGRALLRSDSNKGEAYLLDLANRYADSIPSLTGDVRRELMQRKSRPKSIPVRCGWGN